MTIVRKDRDEMLASITVLAKKARWKPGDRLNLELDENGRIVLINTERGKK